MLPSITDPDDRASMIPQILRTVALVSVTDRHVERSVVVERNSRTELQIARTPRVRDEDVLDVCEHGAVQATPGERDRGASLTSK
jgi:hypothetical protein